MFTYLVLLFTIVPAVELVLLIEVGSRIGAINTLMIIILTGILGAYLARLEGFLVVRKIQDSLNKGIMPSSELIDGTLILAGGILLLTPGFATDTLGFLLLIPLTRDLIKIWVGKKFEQMIKEGRVSHYSSVNFDNQDDYYDDIDIN